MLPSSALDAAITLITFFGLGKNFKLTNVIKFLNLHTCPQNLSLPKMGFNRDCGQKT